MHWMKLGPRSWTLPRVPRSGSTQLGYKSFPIPRPDSGDGYLPRGRLAGGSQIAGRFYLPFGDLMVFVPRPFVSSHVSSVTTVHILHLWNTNGNHKFECLAFSVIRASFESCLYFTFMEH